jgi:maltose alpha-D-glucosyltransferase/alpha-amylase
MPFLTDQSMDAVSVLALVGSFLHGSRIGGAHGEVTCADTTESLRRVLSFAGTGAPTVVPIGVEQSNTSVRIGTGHVFKLFRRLDAGESPQLEVGRFLTQADFRGSPSLEGSLTYRGADGRAATLGVVESWVDNRGDGWRHVVSQLERLGGDSGVLDALRDDLVLLGIATAEFHMMMASGKGHESFAPEPVLPFDVDRWRLALRAQGERTFAIVDRQHHHWQGAAADAARELLERRAAFDARVALAEQAHEPLLKIRVHGDYHLGQVLKTPSGFIIIDFEGEPSKSLAERRLKQCALKDVAGMLRSFDYAVERTPGVKAAGCSARTLCDAFLDGYRDRIMTGPAHVVPQNPATFAAWTAFFELEKVLYEIEYEANSRPAWVHIPLNGANRILRNS